MVMIAETMVEGERNNINTLLYKIDNSKESTAQHRDVYSITGNNLYGKKEWIYTHTHTQLMYFAVHLKLTQHSFFFFLFSFFVFCLFRAAHAAYGGSQARGQIGAVAAGLHQSHSNTGSKPHLRPKHHSSWQCRILNPLSEVRDQTHNLMVLSQIR